MNNHNDLGWNQTDVDIIQGLELVLTNKINWLPYGWTITGQIKPIHCQTTKYLGNKSNWKKKEREYFSIDN